MNVLLATLIFCAFTLSYGSDCPKYSWKPISYGIQIDTDIYKNESSFRGEVIIKGITTKETNTLVLHSGVNLTQVFYTIDGQCFHPITNQSETVLTLTLNDILKSGQNFSLNLKYNVTKMPKHLNLSYNKQNGTLRPVFATDFEPSEARFVFPCLDIPKYKAYFDLKLARPQYMMALSNMPLLSTSEPDPEVGNQVWDTFYTSKHPMSTYVFAFVIFDGYEKIPIDENKAIWYPKNMSSSKYKLSAKVIPEILKLFEDYTGIKYDFPKLDLFFPPKRVYPAMENWGLIFYCNEHFETEYDSIKLIESLTHEIGHQWFGNLVTCKYWCHLWTNEALNTYMTHVITNKFLPSSKNMETLIAKKYTDHWRAMMADWNDPKALSNTSSCCDEYHPVEFEPLIYSKGSLVIGMAANHIMDEVSFQKGIRKYLKHNAYGTVRGFELWNALEEEIDSNTLPESLAEIMETWIINSGYPILNVYRFPNGSVAVEQVSYHTGQFWWIPLTFTTSKSKDFNDLKTKIWIKPNSEKQLLDIKLEDDEWIIFNIQSFGYYGVNYDLKSWKLIIDNLLRSHTDIHPYNRADLFIWADKYVGESLTLTDLLDLLSCLKNEEEYLPFDCGMFTFYNFLARSERRKSYTDKILDFYCGITNDRFRYINSRRFQMSDLSRWNYANHVIKKVCADIYDAAPKEFLESTVKSILNNSSSALIVSPSEFWCRAMLSMDDQRIVDYVKQKYIEEENCGSSPYLKALCCAQKSKYIKKVLNDIIFANKSENRNLTCLIYSCENLKNENCFVVNFIIENYDNITIYEKRSERFKKSIVRLLDFQPYKCVLKLIQWRKENIILEFRTEDQFTEEDTVIKNWFNNRNLTIEENLISEDFVPNTDLYFVKSELDFLKLL